MLMHVYESTNTICVHVAHKMHEAHVHHTYYIPQLKVSPHIGQLQSPLLRIQHKEV